MCASSQPRQSGRAREVTYISSLHPVCLSLLSSPHTQTLYKADGNTDDMAQSVCFYVQCSSTDGVWHKRRFKDLRFNSQQGHRLEVICLHKDVKTTAATDQKALR